MCLVAVFFSFLLTAYGQRAFPGAEGFGAQAAGGRGGRVIEVTNLNDSGPGSFREAVTAQGPRTVVFRTGGTIQLLTPLTLSSSFLTIAGQTAPGGGITIRSPHQIDFGGEGDVHDVIVRFVRFRYDIANGSPTGDIVNVGGYNIIFDHCSFSWGTDETFSIGGHHVTVQWCIISEGLTKGSAFSEGAHHLSIHHNLWAHHRERSPKMRGEPDRLSGEPALFDFVNNVVYNWMDSATDVAGSSLANVVNNYYKAGPDTPPPQTIAEIVRLQDACVLTPSGDCVPGTERQIYVSGNFGPSCRFLDCADQWNSVISDVAGVRGRNTAVDTPHAVPSVTTSAALAVFEEVLAGAGVTLPRREEVDTRVVEEVRGGTGRMIAGDPTLLTGWPVLESGTPPVDSDQDGMADSWESDNFQGLGRDGRSDFDGDGYTDLEEYLDWLVTSASTPPPNPAVTCVLSVDKPVTRAGEPVTFQVHSNHHGLRTHYSGTKDGATDLANLQIGFTPLTNHWTAKEGLYARSVQLWDPGGNVVCDSNTVTVAVASSPPTDPGLTCQLTIDKPIVKVGEQVTFHVESNVSGLRVYYTGTRNGISDVSDFEAGVTPLTTTWIAKEGLYSRFVTLRDPNENAVRVCNTVTTSVILPPKSDVSAQSSVTGGDGGGLK